MDGFIHQLIRENIYFSLNYDRISPENSSVIITTNTEAQYNYFVNWFRISIIEDNTLEVKMEDISDFPQITWSGLIPPTK